MKQARSLPEPEGFNRAVRAGCMAGDVHLTCTFPDCKCKTTPRIVNGALEEWEGATLGQGEPEK